MVTSEQITMAPRRKAQIIVANRRANLDRVLGKGRKGSKGKKPQGVVPFATAQRQKK